MRWKWVWAVVLAGSAVAFGDETAVYVNNFEKAVGPEWSRQKTDVTPAGKRRFLGQFSNEEVHLRVGGLGPHQYIRISLDLLILRSLSRPAVRLGDTPRHRNPPIGGCQGYLFRATRNPCTFPHFG